jgi:hypothetical protein
VPPVASRRSALYVGGALEAVPLGDPERRHVFWVDQQRCHAVLGVFPEVSEHETDGAGRIAPTTVSREDVISDVHLLRSEPPSIVVAVVVDPADDRSVNDDAELGGRDGGAIADEASERCVPCSDDQRGLAGLEQSQRHHADLRSSVVHSVSLS